jgi:hypothetical protein
MLQHQTSTTPTPHPTTLQPEPALASIRHPIFTTTSIHVRALRALSPSNTTPSTMTTAASPPSSKPLLGGQIALITGATGSIGKATARLLASLGASVALHYNSDQDGATQLQSELTNEYQGRFGSTFDGWKADFGDYDDVCSPLSWLCLRHPRAILTQTTRSALFMPVLYRV